MPTPYGVTTPAASSQGTIGAGVNGHPGTMAVASPRPAALDDSALGGPYNQPSAVSPDYILPDKYWTRSSWHWSMPGFRRVSTNVAPVPAPFVARTGTQTQMRTRIGGRTVTGWPRQFTRWPTYKEVQ
jgi:hypothetical protein